MKINPDGKTVALSLETDVTNTESEEKLEIPLRDVQIPQETYLKQKDAAILFDENFVNHLLGYMYRSDSEYSLRYYAGIDDIFKRPPFDSMPPAISEGLLTRSAISVVPGLKESKDEHRQFDLSCTFAEQKLQEFLKEVKPS